MVTVTKLEGGRAICTRHTCQRAHTRTRRRFDTSNGGPTEQMGTPPLRVIYPATKLHNTIMTRSTCLFSRSMLNKPERLWTGSALDRLWTGRALDRSALDWIGSGTGRFCTGSVLDRVGSGPVDFRPECLWTGAALDQVGSGPVGFRPE